jgi:exodeoxyribonuclease VII small subunit
VSRSEQKSAGKAAAEQPAPEPYDHLVARLERVVEELEGGALTLEQSIERFAEGVRLAREAARKLDEAERRVETLLRSEDGGVASRPLEGEGREGGP